MYIWEINIPIDGVKTTREVLFYFLDATSFGFFSKYNRSHFDSAAICIKYFYTCFAFDCRF